jgi:hypothetical protein
MSRQPNGHEGEPTRVSPDEDIISPLIEEARRMDRESSRRRALPHGTPCPDCGDEHVFDGTWTRCGRQQNAASRDAVVLRHALSIATVPERATWLLKPYIERLAMILMVGAEECRGEVACESATRSV